MSETCAKSGGGQYRPVALYYEAADCVEYVRRDEPTIYRRVDEMLTLILSLESRDPIGFQLKGFRHFYLEHLQKDVAVQKSDFVDLVHALEAAISVVGERIFDEASRRIAYEQAKTIAADDCASLRDIPRVA